MKDLVQAAAADLSPDDPWRHWRGVNPLAFVTLPFAWATSMQRLVLENRLPLSGDVNQVIRACGEAFAQVGLFNFNIAGAKDPALEKEIGAEYSYGRQLGRIMDVLAPLVHERRALFQADPERSKELDDFEAMAAHIERMKKARGVQGIVDEVKGWREDEDFRVKFDRLLSALLEIDRQG
ncbi:MAG TPA: hypothetical protein VFZ93_03785 [Albitalea sp.]